MAKKGHVPQRMCVICRCRFDRHDLARYVAGAEGALQADLNKTMPGRGWYVCASPRCQARFGKFRPKKRPACNEGKRGRRGDI